MLIRQETEKDYRQVYKLIKTAFASAEHSDGNEQDLVSALRKGAAFVPQLSLVAEIDGQIAGHILFTEAMVGRVTVLALAPLSVLPAYQRQGIGRRLWEYLLNHSSNMVFTVNSSPYAVPVYHKLGFKDMDEEQLTDGMRYTPMRFEL